MIWSGIMARKNKTKLVSLDDECWRILVEESAPRMQSVYVRNAIRHYYQWRHAGAEIPLVKDGTLANRYDANTINMRILEKEDLLEGMTKRWNDAYVENLELKKQLSKYQDQKEIKNNKKMSKWWHFFFIGLRK